MFVMLKDAEASNKAKQKIYSYLIQMYIKRKQLSTSSFKEFFTA